MATKLKIELTSRQRFKFNKLFSSLQFINSSLAFFSQFPTRFEGFFLNNLADFFSQSFTELRGF